MNGEDDEQRRSVSRMYLERLDEGPQKRSDSLATTQQLHKPHHAEQSEEADTHE